MNTFEVLFPVLLKAAIYVPAVAIFLYLAFHEVWIPIRDLQENYEAFTQIPRKSRRDHVQFWVFGRLPQNNARAWYEERDAA